MFQLSVRNQKNCLLLWKIEGTFQAITHGLLNSNSSNPLRVKSLEKYSSLVPRHLFREGLHNSLSAFVGNATSVAGCVCFSAEITFPAVGELSQPESAPVRSLYLLFWPNTSFFFFKFQLCFLKSSTAGKL